MEPPPASPAPPSASIALRSARSNPWLAVWSGSPALPRSPPSPSPSRPPAWRRLRSAASRLLFLERSAALCFWFLAAREGDEPRDPEEEPESESE
jgi:hypothetical protein